MFFFLDTVIKDVFQIHKNAREHIAGFFIFKGEMNVNSLHFLGFF